MAYQIDFTAPNYVRRSRRKTFLRLLLLAAVASVVWGVHYVWDVYNQPTLNMKLAEYEAAARPIEEMNAAWDTAAKEYASILRYYRLIWAANPTNFLNAMASKDAPKLSRGFHPRSWSLKTGGECKLDYLYVFEPGDKAEQTKTIEDALAGAVTSVVRVVGNKVEIAGVLHENLLRLDDLSLNVRFSLPDVRRFPAKEKAMTECVGEITSFRRKVHETNIPAAKNSRNIPKSAQAMMIEYLPIGKDKPDYPAFGDVVNVAGWFNQADQFIAKNGIPGDDAKRRDIKAAWNNIGMARFPWDRFRLFDNDALVENTKALAAVSDGVKRFKSFLDERHADSRRKLEPLIGGYAHSDVFNKPLVEADLDGRVAKAAGISRVRVSFKDEPGAEPALLDKEDEKFVFTWVRWTLALGDAVARGERGASPERDERPAENEDPLTLAKIADCARCALELGPGYVLDTVKMEFRPDGSVSGAILEGLLPVKKVEQKKEATANAQ